jgi:ferric-dicitrate binding protein FerR (iron transport regulator)
MTMLKQEEIEKIERYINGLSDDKEKSFVESLFSNGENNSLLRHHLEKDWDLMLRESSPVDFNLDHILDHVHHIIRKNETLERRKPLQKFMRVYMKAAAILLLPLLIAGGLALRYVGYHGMKSTDRQVSSTIYAPLGARVSFTLPDGTTGMLNSGSHLSYSLPFTSNRQVKLEGEAWLEVNRDKEHPFEISTGSSTVKVLGTSFNVSAYPAENYVEVVLQQGKVEFLDRESKVKETMLPSERLIFQNGNISKSAIDPAKYYAWTEGKLIFRGDPMDEVARRIERWYNVKVVLADQELEKYSFRATFEDDTLEDVLRFLSMTSPIKYKITPRELMSDGTYKKELITIYLKK